MPDLDPLSGPVIRTSAPAPLQGQPTGYGTGLLGAFTAGATSSLGVSLVARSVPGDANNQFLSHDDAAKQFTDAGLDPAVIPKAGIYQSGLNAIKEQQTIVNNATDAAQRSSGAGGVGQFVAALAGGFTDPLFLGLGPLGKIGGTALEAVGVAKGASLVARVATGTAEGGAVIGGYTVAQRKLGTAPGDPDITSYTILRQTGVGMAFGGAVKGAFGTRPLDTNTVAALERSENVAKKLNISVDDVVSPTGAVGKHQVEPATAKAIMGAGFDVSTLHDPVVNKEVAQKILEANNKAFPGDEEAQVIAYNAGPGRTREWINAGRNDAVLSTETQKYVEHYREIRDENPVAQAAALPKEVQDSAMKIAVAQMSQDSDVNVQPIIENGLKEAEQEPLEPFTTNPAKIANEHEAEMSQIAADATRFVERRLTPRPEAPPPSLLDALPKPGSANVNERLSAEMLDQVNAKAAAAKPAESSELTDLKAQVADAIKYAANAHVMAFGEPVEGASNALKDVLAKSDEDGKQDDELAKGVDAAVRCGAMKGFS